MRRYATSKLRLILLAGMLLAAGVLLSTSGSHAQDSPAPGGAVPSAAAPSATPGATPAAQKVGLAALILQNIDFVFFIIILLSVTGLTLIIQGFIKNRAAVFMPPQTTNLIREMIAQRRFRELIEFTEQDPSFISKALNPALKRAPSFSAMKEAMETAIGEQTAEQFRKIEYLNIIGNLGPLLGLLGTVLGMIDAFSEMHAAGGNANPAQLAHGISKALAHTFLGLFLAVPCLAAFGVLRTMVDRLTIRGALVAEELLLMIKPAEARPAVPSPTIPAGMRAAPQPNIGIPQPVAPPPPAMGRAKPSISPQP
ncbi:MotA/TolQ/ExbB proton channel family protein [Fontivita pretiosa]|uniref:MotA/TolQ/ExbB proton channel family protein n=1 Tax=Fontivita pretiosa TaxID=2989684 RepID=UPI003D17C9AF